MVCSAPATVTVLPMAFTTSVMIWMRRCIFVSSNECETPYTRSMRLAMRARKVLSHTFILNVVLMSVIFFSKPSSCTSMPHNSAHVRLSCARISIGSAVLCWTFSFSSPRVSGTSSIDGTWHWSLRE